MKKKTTKKIPNNNPQKLGALVPSMRSTGHPTSLLANLRAVILEARHRRSRLWVWCRSAVAGS